MITAETYLRILRDRLEEAGVDAQTLDRTISREKATIAGVSKEDVASLFTEQRLSVLISSAKRRSENEATRLKDKSIKNSEDESTIAVQCSQTLIPSEDKTIVSNNKTECQTCPIDTNTTIFHSRPEVPRSLLESDTATVIISRPVRKMDTKVESEDSTLSADSFGKVGMEKLFSDTSTVRISEKDTVQFLTLDSEEKTVISAPDPVDEGSTNVVTLRLADDVTNQKTVLPSPNDSHVHDSDTDRTILPFLDDAHEKKKQEHKESLLATKSCATLSDQDLKNQHPIGLFFAVLPIILPIVLLSSSLYAIFFFIVFLTLSLLIALPILFYTFVVSGSGGSIIFCVFCYFRYFSGNAILDIVPLGVILVVSISVLILSLLYLHRPVLPIYTFFKGKLTAFCHKNSVLCRNTIRYFIKSLRHA